MLLQIIVASCLGVTMEVVFTALTDYPKTRDPKLMGYSYVWMIPLYGLAPVVLKVLDPRIGSSLIPFRLALYVSLLLAMEYASGWLIRRLTGECPWERNYKHSPWAVGNGLMRFDYAPAWAVACFIFETVYRALPH